MKEIRSTNRFFAATLIRGNLYVCGIRVWDPWRPSWLEFVSEVVADLSATPAARKVRTREDFEQAIRDAESFEVVRVWIHESLVEDARRLWRRNRWR